MSSTSDKIHKTHFSVVKKRGGNERVKVRTASGYTYLSREQAEELELEIVPKKRDNAGDEPEERNDADTRTTT